MYSKVVVICFHFTIFVVLTTTLAYPYSFKLMLWFAFILLSLSYWQQRDIYLALKNYSCDLLSFYYLCRTDNNSPSTVSGASKVVICFHFTIFVVLTTTRKRLQRIERRLWFAFILLSLSYWQQPWPNSTMRPSVVICFHFTIFVVLTTTARPFSHPPGRLWFAFILLSLSYWQQLRELQNVAPRCCDLLSFYYLCRTDNNVTAMVSDKELVVICFHFTIFVVLTTTIKAVKLTCRGCDLLSFYYLCRTDNNNGLADAPLSHVVICFHFTIFVVLTTTKTLRGSSIRTLWFAFILLSLSYWQQRRGEIQSFGNCCDLLSFYYLCRTDNNLQRAGVG